MEEITFQVSRCEESRWPVASWDDPTGQGGITTQARDLRELQEQIETAGKEKDKEVVYNKVQFKIKDEAADKLTVTPEGKDTGKKPMKFATDQTMTVEVPDESTVVINDPKKGKLVYKKKLGPSERASGPAFLVEGGASS